MIPKECKRLAEVDFPIAEVSKHSAREKSIRYGHPSTLHLWWARRPLAACRAMLMALLLPDPCDPFCPNGFGAEARGILLKKHGRPVRWEADTATPEGLRKTLLEFIGDLSNWDNSANMDYLLVARNLVKAAHQDDTPLVVDPFSGGGSIPLEALRLGCEAFASDLNPVACLINKVMLQDIPRYGSKLAEELRRVGDNVKRLAEKQLAEFYPKDQDGAIPIAYLWARTVRCESPNCGAEIPLLRSFWLSKKSNKKRALRYKILRPTNGTPQVEFEIFEPKAEKDVVVGSVTRARATCLCCNTVLPPERVRAQLADQRGGADSIYDDNGNRIGGAKMTAVVTLSPGIKGRNYRVPTDIDYQAVRKAQNHLRTFMDEWERSGKKGYCPVPDEPLPIERAQGNSGFRVLLYGMSVFGDLFSSRQKLTNVVLREIVRTQVLDEVIKEILCLALSRRVDISNALCPWSVGATQVVHLFGRQAIPMAWDFGETSPFGGMAGDFNVTLGTMIRVVERLSSQMIPAETQIADATSHVLPDQSATTWFTDPPYYDSVAYADLSDFFFVWLKRALPEHPLLRNPFEKHNTLTPKDLEAIQDINRTAGGKQKDKSFYEACMAGAFAEGRRVLRPDGIGSVVFAHKTTEGWEALLSGMISGRWTITSSWPIATERPGRLLSQDTAALATSIHLVCRPRPDDAPVGDWSAVLRELPERVGNWMEKLQGEGVRGADLVFSCIGPALEIFSRYKRVETAEGLEVKLATYLEKVWEVVGRTALEQVLGTAEAKARNGAAGAIEEDARLTALFLWTLQSTNVDTTNGNAKSEDEGDEEEGPRGKSKGYSLIFDVARRFAQPLGIDLPKWEGRIIETEKGVVRLMSVSERTKQIFGSTGVEPVVDELISSSSSGQMFLPGFEELAGKRSLRRVGRNKKIKVEDSGEIDMSATTLDRVHAAMLLQAGGQANGLRALIKTEQDRGSGFLRLANALSALYPPGSEEKRLLDAMLLAVPR